MVHRELGKTGLKVSEVGLGCGPLGSDPHRDYGPLLDRALDLGVNFYDTADFYGSYRSEEWLGRAFSAKRDQVIIATKFGTVRTVDGMKKDWSAAHMRRALEDSLRRLRTDYVDLYQLHSPPRSILDDDDLLAGLYRVKEEGKIRFIGISLDGAQFAIEAIRKWQPDALQILFNLFNFEPSGCFVAAQEAGVGLIIKAPLDSGMLGGDLMPGAPLKGDDPRERWRDDETAQRQRLLRELAFLTEGKQRTWAQASLAFVLSFAAVSTVIPGTTSIEHLQEDVAAAGMRLGEEEMQRLRGLMNGEFADLNLGW